MDRLILVQAGSTAWEKCVAEGGDDKPCADERRLQGTLPLPLSQAGKDGLRQIAQVLKLEGARRIYSSGNESSGSTAEFLEELCGLKAKRLPELRELNCGLWQGLRIKEIKQRYATAFKQWRTDPFSVCPPEGENLAEAWQRVAESLAQIHRKNKKMPVVIVAAPIVAGIIENIITRKERAELWPAILREQPLRKFQIDGCNKEKVPFGILTLPVEQEAPAIAGSVQ